MLTLKNLKDLIQEKDRKFGMTTPGTVHLATGVGSMDWEDACPLIYKHLEYLDIPIYLYTL